MRRKFSSVQKNFLLQELSKSFNSPEEKNPEKIYGVKKEPADGGEKMFNTLCYNGNKSLPCSCFFSYFPLPPLQLFRQH